MKRALVGMVISALVFSSAAFGAAAPGQEISYRVNAGDVLEISVWGHETLRREIAVPPDGVIAFPLIREIDVRGMNVSAIREAVTAKLSAFVPDATVTVILLKSVGLTAYVIGKVNKAGQFPTYLDTTVMQILSMAGGFTPFASPDKIFILRQVEGKPQKIPFDYNQVVNGKHLEQDIVLQRGDVVVVP